MSDKNEKYNNTESLRLVSNTILVVLVIALILVTVSFVRLINSTSELSKANANQVVSYKLANELRQSTNDLTRMARSYVETSNPEYLRQYNTVLSIRNGNTPRPEDYHRIYWDLIDVDNPSKPRPDTEKKSLNSLLKAAGFTKEEFDKLNLAEEYSNELAQQEIEAFNVIKGLYKTQDGIYAKIGLPNPELAKKLLFSSAYSAQKTKIMKPIDEFYALMENRISNSLESASKSLRQSEYMFFGLIFISGLLILSFYLVNLKLNRLRLAEREQAQAKAEAENEQLNNSVIGVLQSVAKISQKDLTVRAPVTEDVVGTVSDSINFMTDETSRVLKEVTQVADRVKNSSEKVQTQASLVSETAEAERKDVDNMMNSLLEATQSMNRVAALAEESNQSSTKATEVTENALETVNGTVKGMESIRETIAETEKRIKRLGERSQEISGIVNLINTISERTHVLALNASMQAAVAGEAGRGFAVVAEEVQRLAESSRNATQQIASLVSNIQLETNETINTVNNTIDQVVEGSNQAQQAGEQMRETQRITAQLVEQVRSIAQASEQQKDMSVKLLNSVQKIGESTEQTASQIIVQNQETQSLQEAAQKLVESVGVFKLPA